MLSIKEIKSNYVVIEDTHRIFYFSYNTLIAFKIEGSLYIRENVWGSTTGKHLNNVSRVKEIRISKEKFEEAYKQHNI